MAAAPPAAPPGPPQSPPSAPAPPSEFKFETWRDGLAETMDKEFDAKRTPDEIKTGKRFEAGKVLGTIKTLDDMGKMLVHGQKRMGGLVAIPGADAKPEDVAKFRAQLGVPETADKYTWQRTPAMLAAGVTEDNVKEFLNSAHKAGFTQAQTDGALAWYSEYLGGVAKNVLADQQEGFARIKTAHPHDVERIQDVCNQIVTRHGGPQIVAEKNEDGSIKSYTNPMKMLLMKMAVLDSQGNLVNPEFFEFFKNLEPSMREARMIQESGEWTKETPSSVDGRIKEIGDQIYSKTKPLDRSSEQYKTLVAEWNRLHEQKYRMEHPGT